MIKAWKTVSKPKRTVNFTPGDTVRVFLKVSEGEGAERTQAYEGVVISHRGSGISESFTVRKISFGVGVERTFPVQSPRIEKIVRVKGGRVRRAKLFYLRDKSGKAARLDDIEETGDSTAQAADGTTLPKAVKAAAELEEKAPQQV